MPMLRGRDKPTPEQRLVILAKRKARKEAEKAARAEARARIEAAFRVEQTTKVPVIEYRKRKILDIPKDAN